MGKEEFLTGQRLRDRNKNPIKNSHSHKKKVYTGSLRELQGADWLKGFYRHSFHTFIDKLFRGLFQPRFNEDSLFGSGKKPVQNDGPGRAGMVKGCEQRSHSCIGTA